MPENTGSSPRNARRRRMAPRYRRQRHSLRADRAFVELSGQRIYLGEFGSEGSWEMYHRVVAEWAASGRRPREGTTDITVNEIIVQFSLYADSYYRRADGSPTGEFDNFKQAMRPLRRLYGRTPAAEFGPMALKAVRQTLIDDGLARTTVNASTRRLRQVFKWAVSEELLPADVLHALQSVPPLKRGRTEAREPNPIRPVPRQDVEAVRPHVSRQVWTLIQVQLLTGARSGELLPMRAVDLDTTGSVWVYKPQSHKNDYRDQERQIYLGPRAQDLIRGFLVNRSLTAPLFSPREAEAERSITRHADRRTPPGRGNMPGSHLSSEARRRSPGEMYDTRSYARAIRRACEQAMIAVWSPHRLRHTRATEIRREYGLEVSRVICGHRSTAATEIYAEVDHQRAIELMGKIG